MPFLNMPPKQGYGVAPGAMRVDKGKGRDTESSDRCSRMANQSYMGMDTDYHNLPEITWNAETFNYDAEDFTVQESPSSATRNVISMETHIDTSMNPMTSIENDSSLSVNEMMAVSAMQARRPSPRRNERARASPQPKKTLRPCSHCGKTFTRSYDLNRHESSHSDERRYACEYPGCNKRYKLRQDLKAHERNAHEGRGGGGAVVLGHWRGFEDKLFSM